MHLNNTPPSHYPYPSGRFVLLMWKQYSQKLDNQGGCGLHSHLS